ncbi:MAG: hypothetical protein JNM41_00675 [Flavipsychrobacter sp.]|nr:hypothetical protein [Flavipsychrobacter sp.]
MKNTIEQIESVYWGKPEFDSHLVVTCHQLRKKNLDDFEIEDLRIMIGQNIALPILIPIAIKVLKTNILAEGDYYEGDLLKNVLTSEKDFWDNHSDYRNEIISLVEEKLEDIQKMDTTDEIRVSIFEAFEAFKR